MQNDVMRRISYPSVLWVRSLWSIDLLWPTEALFLEDSRLLLQTDCDKLCGLLIMAGAFEKDENRFSISQRARSDQSTWLRLNNYSNEIN
jgi:hypothetical protein